MRTVFILGAGASYPYGFPLGKKLVEDILDVLTSHSENFINWGFDDKIDSFKKAIEDSKPDAIDFLLVQQPTFLKIGKAAIAHALVQYENEQTLKRRDVEDDWYSYFFKHLRELKYTVQPEQYSFITFNYDRSLEHYLDIATQGHYGNTDPQKKEAILSIPILHIHGHLGVLPSRGGNYPFTPTQERSRIITISRNLRLTDEEVDPGTLSSAQILIQKAERIRFLGFGYHDTNLKKIRI